MKAGDEKFMTKSINMPNYCAIISSVDFLETFGLINYLRSLLGRSAWEEVVIAWIIYNFKNKKFVLPFVIVFYGNTKNGFMHALD